jgi:hypothetical protein
MSHYFYITPEEYQIAEQNGISAATLEVRVRSLAWQKERAINTQPHKKHRLGEWIKVAEQNGICYRTLNYRANQLGWDLERAATQPLQDLRAQAQYAREKGRIYPVEILETASRNGINYDTFRGRVKRGWTLTNAATRPTMTSRECGLQRKAKLAEMEKRLPQRYSPISSKWFVNY